MRISVLETDVCASEKMKHVEAPAMHTAAASTGSPPCRHCATMLRRPAALSTTDRKIDAKKLRQKLVVHGLVVTRRAMRPPVLQQIAADATSSAPRRLGAVIGSMMGLVSARPESFHEMLS